MAYNVGRKADTFSVGGFHRVGLFLGRNTASRFELHGGFYFIVCSEFLQHMPQKPNWRLR